MLTVKNVTKKYRNNVVLNNINLDFENGVYGLIAPNGAGKTTLLKLLTTLSFPDSGEILWNGTNIIKLGEQYREVIGFLPQKFGYYKDYSPYQYLKYLSALKGIKSELAEKRTLELLETVGLKDVINKKMKTFSGGMIQRVGIAQALLNNPQILMLDEPTAGLDPKERVRFRNIISSLSGERIVILSTHIVSDVETVANKIIMFDKSGIICNDTVDNICSELKGKIFETRTDEKALEEFEKNYMILSRRQEGRTVVVRFVDIDESFDNAVEVEPNLEDVFIYKFGNK